MLKVRFFGFLTFVAMVAMLIPAGHAFAATRQVLRSNDNAPDFMLNQPQSFSFSSASGTGIANGAPIDLDPSVVQNTVEETFAHILFASDASGNVTAYIYGSGLPVQMSQNTDGSVNLSYTQSSNTVTASFNGIMANGQINANYQQQTMGGNAVGGQEYIGGTNISASFTAAVTPVTPDEIPAAPSNGSYQLSSDGGVILSWSPAPSNNVAGYDVYRLVLGVDSVPQYIGTVQTAGAIDESQEAIQYAQTATGIMYTVYTVSSSGIENPMDVVIYAESI